MINVINVIDILEINTIQLSHKKVITLTVNRIAYASKFNV